MKKKLAIVMSGCYPGGVTMALSDFLKYIDYDIFDVSLVLRDIDTVKGLSIPETVNIQSWGNQIKLRDMIKRFCFRGFIKCLYLYLMIFVSRYNHGRKTVYQARLYQNLSQDFDIAVAYHMNVNICTVLTLERINAKRRVLWIHGKKTYEQKNKGFFEKLYSKADKIVAVSKDTENRFNRLFPKLANKTITIHNFYDFDTIYRKADEPFDSIKVNDEIVIVSTGRLSKEKGFDRVPEVTKKLVDDGYNIKWYIAGDGDKRESIAADIAEKGLKDHVILTGFITNPYPFVKQCDIYVQPSYTEGFCTSTMEAKILRRPVVATDVPGMNEQFVSEYDGLIVKSSVDGLYQGIKRMIDDKELYQTITDHLNNETFSNDEEVQKAMKAIMG